MKKERLIFFYILLALFIFSYLINLLWEVSHSILYNWNQSHLKNDVYFYIPKIFGATLGDAVIISAIFIINCIFRKGIKWMLSIKKIDYFVFIILGLIFAISIEIRAKLVNSWSYSQYMPLVFGIGITPLIQLSITGTIALFLINKLYIRKK